MRKALIITNLFHASPRIPGLAKYLPEFGWQSIIITGTLPEISSKKFEVIQTPFPNIFALWKKRLHLNPNRRFQEQIGIPFIIRQERNTLSNKLITFIKGVIAYPDEHNNWKHFALRAANELFQKEMIDAIISSSSPVTSHIIAKELKDRYKIPWIADLRDLWTQNHNYPYGPIRKLFEKKLELKVLSFANALVTVSPLWAEKLKVLHKRKEIYTITNGFDPEKINIPPTNLTSKFTITYTGQIYPKKQDPSKLLASLKNLISAGKINPKDIEVRFYGPENELLEWQIKTYGLSSIAKQYGLIPREISIQKQRESHLLLLLNWEDKREKGVYPGKIFEYLAAQRPILATGGSGDDVIEKLLEETKAGVYCKNIEDIENSLEHFYLEYKQRGKVSYKGDVKEISKYSYKDMAEKFVKILNSITE